MDVGFPGYQNFGGHMEGIGTRWTVGLGEVVIWGLGKRVIDVGYPILRIWVHDR